MEAINTKFGTAYSLHLLSVTDKDNDRDKDRDKDPSNHIRTWLGKRLTPTSRTEHLSKFRPDLPANHPGTMGTKFM